MATTLELGEQAKAADVAGLRARAVLGDKGRLVIPAALREALGLQVGTSVELRVVGNELRISTTRSRILEVQKRMREIYGPDRLISDELSAERREAAARGD